MGDHRWTAAYKAEIRASRVLATRALAAALAAAQPRPNAFIVASAIGWYGDTGGREVTEAAPAGKAFLSRVVHDWEAAADPAREAGIRVAHLRSGLVLGAGGGVLGRLALPARLGVLPRFGDGHQVMSWISLTDEIRAIRFLLDGDGAQERSGPYNLTAPNPVTDAELTAALHAAFHRPDFPWLRVPALAAQAGPRRDVRGTAHQRPRAARPAARRRLRVRAPDCSAPPWRPNSPADRAADHWGSFAHGKTRPVRHLGSAGRTRARSEVLRAWLHDDLEVGVAERDLADVPLQRPAPRR